MNMFKWIFNVRAASAIGHVEVQRKVYTVHIHSHSAHNEWEIVY